MESHHLRKKGDQFCQKHPKKELTFSCDDCDDTPVCNLCISRNHKGHEVTDIDFLAQTKYNYIQVFNINTKYIFPKIETNLQRAEDSMSTFEQSISADIDRVEGQRNYLKKKIDSVADRSIFDLKDVLKENQKKIQQFKSTTEESRKRMQKKITENSKDLKSNQNIVLIDIAEELKVIQYELTKFEDIPTVEFQSGKNSDCDRLIEEAFGHIHTVNEAGDPTSARASRKLSGEIKTLLESPQLLLLDPYTVKKTKYGIYTWV